MSDIEKLLSKLMHYNDELTNDDRCDLNDYIEKLQAENAELTKREQKVLNLINDGSWNGYNAVDVIDALNVILKAS